MVAFLCQLFALLVQANDRPPRPSTRSNRKSPNARESGSVRLSSTVAVSGIPSPQSASAVRVDRISRSSSAYCGCSSASSSKSMFWPSSSCPVICSTSMANRSSTKLPELSVAVCRAPNHGRGGSRVRHCTQHVCAASSTRRQTASATGRTMGRLNHEPIRQARLPAAQSAAVDNTGVRYSDAVARTGLTVLGQ